MSGLAVRRVAIYVRISKDEQGLQLGVERQEEMCRQLVREHYGSDAEVVVFSDNNISAWSGARRPAYERLLSDLEVRKFDAVVVYAADRLYRQVRQLERIISVIGEKGPNCVPVMAVMSGSINLTTADGRMHARLLAAVAQNSSDKTSERLRHMNEQAARKGWAPPGRAPYGLKRVKLEGAGWTYEHVSNEVPHVRMMVRSIAGGDSLGMVADKLNRRGVKTRSGKPWAGDDVRRCVISPAIAGLRAHTPRRNKTPVWTQRVAGKGLWDPIVDRHVWENALMTLADEKRRHGSPSAEYWLSGVLISPDGAKLSGGKERRERDGVVLFHHRTYRTPSAVLADGYRYVAVRADEVEAIVEEIMLALGDNFVGEEEDAEEDPTLAERSELEAELAGLARRTALPSSDPDWLHRSEAGAMRPVLLDRLRKLEQEASAAKAPSVLAPGETLREAWPSMTSAEKRAAVLTFVGQIVVLPGRSGVRVPVRDRLQLPAGLAVPSA